MIKDSIHAKHQFPFRMQTKKSIKSALLFFGSRLSLIFNNLQIWLPLGLIIAFDSGTPRFSFISLTFSKET